MVAIGEADAVGHAARAEPADRKRPSDTGLAGLAIAFAVLDRPGELDALRHEAGLDGGLADAVALVRLARAHGLKAAERRDGAKGRGAMPGPA